MSVLLGLRLLPSGNMLRVSRNQSVRVSMTVDEYADVLSSKPLQFYEDGPYFSHKTGKQGYRATYRLGSRWYWYSVSDSCMKVSPAEVAKAVTSEHRRIDRSETYKTDGFEATVRCGSHSYMLNESDTKPRFTECATIG